MERHRHSKGFVLTNRKIKGGNAIVEKANMNSIPTYDIWDKQHFELKTASLDGKKYGKADEQEKNENFSKLMKLDDDHVYYNIVMTNTSTTDPKLATFNEVRTEAIVKVPEDYHLSVIRFTIPTESIPLLVPSIQPGPPPYGPNANFRLTNYSFTLQYMSDDLSTVEDPVQVYVQFFPQNLNATAPKRWDNIGVVQNVNFYSIYAYQHFIDTWNLALSQAFDGLSTAAQTSGIAAPYFIFDPVTQLISLIVPTTYVQPNDTTVPHLHISANTLMGTFLESFQLFYNDTATMGRNYIFNISNNGNNYYNKNFGPLDLVITSGSTAITSTGGYLLPSMAGATLEGNGIVTNTIISSVTNATTGVISSNATASGTYRFNVYDPYYLRISQQSVNLSAFNSIRSIVMTTGEVPIKSEYTPVLSNNATSNFLPILTDFEPQLPESGLDRGLLSYLPTAEYRLVDLKGKNELKRFDLQLFWQDKLLNRYPIYIFPQQSADVKILFRKKSVVK